MVSCVTPHSSKTTIGHCNRPLQSVTIKISWSGQLSYIWSVTYDFRSHEKYCVSKTEGKGGMQFVAGTGIPERADSLVGDHATYNPRAILHIVCVCVCMFRVGEM